MNIAVSYDEIVSYVEKKFVVRLLLKCVDRKTIEISYKKGFLSSSIQVRIESCGGDTICLSYDCSLSTSIIIGVIKQFENKIPHGVDIDTAHKKILLSFAKIEKLENTLSYVEIEDLYCNDNGVNMSLSLK